MSERNSRKSEAYLIWAEWGPNMSIPRDERLATCFPEIVAAEREAWIHDFQNIDKFISKVVSESKAHDYSGEQFALLIRDQFPFMDDSATSKAYFLANYDQWHG